MVNIDQIKRLISEEELTGLAYYHQAVSKEGFGVVQSPAYGPHLCVVSSWFTEKDTLFHSYHPQFSEYSF